MRSLSMHIFFQVRKNEYLRAFVVRPPINAHKLLLSFLLTTITFSEQDSKKLFIVGTNITHFLKLKSFAETNIFYDIMEDVCGCVHVSFHNSVIPSNFKMSSFSQIQWPIWIFHLKDQKFHPMHGQVTKFLRRNQDIPTKRVLPFTNLFVLILLNKHNY